MVERTTVDRRQFLETAVMTVAAAHLGLSGRVQAAGSSPLAAIGGASQFLNSSRLTAQSLAGRVVVVNFCTYSCINWLRTLPYVRAWAQKYREGLTVIGVHTPEFGFEQNVENVRRALRQMRVEYPVAIDNDYAIWRAFDNQYWPALYFIDARGRVRDHQFGEGQYERSERLIQRLLTESGVAGVDRSIVSVDAGGVEAPADWPNLKSGENYVGFERTEQFASPGGAGLNHQRTYSLPKRLTLNAWALAGDWTMGRQATVLDSPNGRIAYRFHARDLHLVMGPLRPGMSVRFRVSIDGHPPGSGHGIDTDEKGCGTVIDPRLYQLIRQSSPILDRQFEIEFPDAGVQAFSFTFG